MHGPFGWRYYAILYAVEAPVANLIKFGRTIDIKHRFGALCAQSPVPLVLVGSVWLPDDAEAEAHSHLDEDRAHGEWFAATEKVRSLANLIAGKKVIDLSYILELDRMLLKPPDVHPLFA